MRDESRGVNIIEPKPIPAQKIVKPKLWPCAKCSKPTRSHRFSDGVCLCHGCMEKMSQEEQDEFTRMHTKDRYPPRSSGATTTDSSSTSEAEQQKM